MATLKHQTDNTKNGRIVVMADKRYNTEGDLPAHIDIVECHSDDNGKTWSAHQTVAGTEEDHALIRSTSGNKGFGDAAIVECQNGRLVAIMVAGAGFFQATNADPGETFIITSDDAGTTWSNPRSLYELVYKNTTYARGTLNATFAGSGRGLLLQRGEHKGRIMFAMSHRFDNQTYDEYIIYSDDNGDTWKMSTETAYTGGDESKLVELNDGTVMISVRQDGKRGFNTSKDGGLTWGDQWQNSQLPGNRNNADILYLDEHVMVHTYVNEYARKKLHITASYDNGQTWTDKFQICEPFSAYSTTDITKDGNIAVLYEDGSWGINAKGERDGYNINYIELPKSWFVSADAEKKAYESALAKAQTMTSTTGYKHPIVGTAGQYSQASLDALKEAVASADASNPGAAATAIEKAISAVEESAVVAVPGFSSDVYFTISSKENVKGNNDKPIYIDATGAPVDSAQTAVWQITPNVNLGQVNIKQKDQNNYLYRSGATLKNTTSKLGWTITHDDANDCYHLMAVHNGNSYLVIDVTSATASFNYWNKPEGNTQWSTKFLLTPVAKKGKDTATYKKYDVKFVNAPAGAYVTYGADEAAVSGGVMFLSESDVAKIKGEAAAQAARRIAGLTAPASTDDDAASTTDEGLVVHDAGSYYATTTIDDEGTLTVTYSILPTFRAETTIAESGWYQIKQTVSKTNSSALESLITSGGNYLGAAETGYKSTLGSGAGFYSLKYLTPSETTPAQSFLYITKDSSNYHLQTVTGHYFTSMAIATTSPANINIVAQSDSCFTLGSYYDYYAPGGTDSPLLGGYRASSTATFQISKVDTTKYAVYHVSITGDPTTPTSLSGNKAVGEYAYVTYKGSANLGITNVYDKGAFFLQSGTTPTTSDFTPRNVGLCYSGTVSVDTVKKTVTVAYALDEKKVNAFCDSAMTLLNNRAVGSPTTSSSVYTTLQSAISTLQITKNLTNVNALASAIASYRAVTDISTIVMPEDGKAYTITSVGVDGKRASYFKYQEGGYTLVETTGTSNADYPMEAKFIARKISDGVYTFVNNAGKYFIWKGSSTSSAPNSNKGYTDAYNDTYKLTLERMTTSGYTGSKTNADFAGMMTIKGYRNNGQQNYFVIKNKTSFDQANVKFYNTSGSNNFSSALLIEETTYPNTPSLGDSKGLDGAPYIGTFSAPFPTVIPEGVKAYYVKKNEDNTAVTEQVSTEAIPASQGVLLVSDENKGTLTMLPAATESADAGITDYNNLLGNSAGMENGKTFTEDEAYILTTKYGTASFHLVTASTLKINKSYLRKEAANTSSRQISIRFGQGPATSIDALINPDKTSNAPVYDLSGRRLNGVPAKGIYIQGGKKYVK